MKVKSRIDSPPITPKTEKVVLPWKKILIIGAIVTGVLLLTTVPSLYFYDKFKRTQAQILSTPTNPNPELKMILDKVARLIDLPSDEIPSLATVADVEKLKGQPFFSKAKNGDKVLIYAKSSKAILYDPGADKVLDVTTIRTNTSTTTPTQNTPPKLALYNGTTTTGLTKIMEQELKTKLPNMNVILKTNAEKSEYEKTLVTDVSGKHPNEAAQVAQALGAQLSTLPVNEPTPPIQEGNSTVDILIIIGKDYVK